MWTKDGNRHVYSCDVTGNDYDGVVYVLECCGTFFYTQPGVDDVDVYYRGSHDIDVAKLECLKGFLRDGTIDDSAESRVRGG